MSWLSKINLNKIHLIRCKTNLFFGCGAINKIDDICKILKRKNLTRMLIATGKNSYKTCGAWDVVEKALKNNSIDYVVFNEFQPNPLVQDVEKCVKIASQFKANVVLAIGGGSVIDSAKAVSVWINYPNAQLYDLYKETGKFPKHPNALPIIAINTTHGTGTETDRYSVITFPETKEKLGCGLENLYPLYAIDDPNLCKNLPLNQTLYTSIDAVNHATESATTKSTTPYSILLARDCIKMVVEFLPKVIKEPKNELYRYYLHYASALGGIGIDNSAVHLTHNMEHPLSAIKQELPHGLGLAILLPAVLKEIYESCWEILVDIYAPLLPSNIKWGSDLSKEADIIAKCVEDWLFSLGVKEKLKDVGFTKGDIDQLIPMAEEMMNKQSPVEVSKELIRRIYENSYQPMYNK